MSAASVYTTTCVIVKSHLSGEGEKGRCISRASSDRRWWYDKIITRGWLVPYSSPTDKPLQQGWRLTATSKETHHSYLRVALSHQSHCSTGRNLKVEVFEDLVVGSGRVREVHVPENARTARTPEQKKNKKKKKSKKMKKKKREQPENKLRVVLTNRQLSLTIEGGRSVTVVLTISLNAVLVAIGYSFPVFEG